MLRILVLFLILLPTISNADQGLKISCLNMKSILGKKYGNLCFKQFKFGWPSKLDEKGPFWTHFDKINEFERVLKFIRTVNDKEWVKLIMHKKLSSIIPPYDKNNSLFDHSIVQSCKRHNFIIELHVYKL